MNELIFHDRFSPDYRSPLGAVPSGTKVILQTELSRRLPSASCVLILWPDEGEAVRTACTHDDLSSGRDKFFAETTLLIPGLYWYRFEAQDIWGNVIAGTGNYQITVYDEGFKTPDWIKGGILYHIFVDRFCQGKEAKKAMLELAADSDTAAVSQGGSVIKDRVIDRHGRILRTDWGGLPDYLPDEEGIVRNEDFFGGDLAGIIEKLPYLVSLGVTCIYLSPIFKAASNHKYDTGDYMEIDPGFGTEADFWRLCKEAKALGMGVILDGVFSHTGSDSRYFNREGNYDGVGAYDSKKSPYYSWYRFEEYPSQYKAWWGIDTLPEINEDDPSYRKFICGPEGVLKYWLSAGASGYRLDVADELTDRFLDNLRKSVKEENPEALIIGEVWEDASSKISYGHRRRYFLGSQLDSVTNYPFKDGVIDFLRNRNSEGLGATVRQICGNYPKAVVDCLMNTFGSHDTERLLTSLAGKRLGDSPKSVWATTFLTEEELALGLKLIRMASLLQMTLPGFPCIYYGDEAGMEGYGDPFCRYCYPWGKEDRALLDWYRRLGQIRMENSLLKDGLYEEVCSEGGVFAFRRKRIFHRRRSADKVGGEDMPSETLIVAVNRGTEPFTLVLTAPGEDLLTGRKFESEAVLAENEYILLKQF